MIDIIFCITGILVAILAIFLLGPLFLSALGYALQQWIDLIKTLRGKK